MNCFWAAKKTIIVGSATMIAPAAIRLLSTKKLPLRLLSADVIGMRSLLFISSSAQKKSL